VDGRQQPLLDIHHIGSGQGGNETWAVNVMRAVERLGHRPEYAATPAGLATAAAIAAPSRVHRISGSSARRLAWDLPRLVAQLQPAALFVQYSAPVPTRVPLVTLVHDCAFMYAAATDWLPPLSLARYRRSIARGIEKASVVLVPSAYVRGDVQRFFPLRRDQEVLLAPNAVDEELLAALDRLEGVVEGVEPEPPAAARPGRRRALFVGNPLPRKNLPLAAAAIDRLNQARGGEKWDLVLVGAVDGRGEPAAAAARGTLGDRLVLTGRVSIDELARLYRSSDVLLYPSLSEGFGIPPIEAMAAGLPAIVSAHTCLPEIVGDAAQVIDTDDPGDWAAAIERAVTDRDHWAAAGAKHAASYSWDTAATALMSALSRSALR
jgi:glycosyltransferase involved in cell wall biosynthesis